MFAVVNTVHTKKAACSAALAGFARENALQRGAIVESGFLLKAGASGFNFVLRLGFLQCFIKGGAELFELSAGSDICVAIYFIFKLLYNKCVISISTFVSTSSKKDSSQTQSSSKE